MLANHLDMIQDQNYMYPDEDSWFPVVTRSVRESPVRGSSSGEIGRSALLGPPEAFGIEDSVA